MKTWVAVSSPVELLVFARNFVVMLGRALKWVLSILCLQRFYCAVSASLSAGQVDFTEPQQAVTGRDVGGSQWVCWFVLFKPYLMTSTPASCYIIQDNWTLTIKPTRKTFLIHIQVFITPDIPPSIGELSTVTFSHPVTAGLASAPPYFKDWAVEDGYFLSTSFRIYLFFLTHMYETFGL